ncbi:MAG: extracellular solute-binding protein [Thermoprotei archaeon]
MASAITKVQATVITVIVIIAAIAGIYYLLYAGPGAGGVVTVELTGNFETDAINIGKALANNGITSVKYTVWSGGDPNSVMRVYGVVEAAARIMKIWRDNGINVEIKVETRYESKPDAVYNDYVSKWPLGQAPDIMANGYVYIASLAEEGYILDLTPYLEKYSSFLNDFYPAIIEAMKYKGKIYGIPQDTEARPIYIRKDVAACAGIDLTGLADKVKNGEFTWRDLYNLALQAKNAGCAEWGLIHRKGSAHPDLIQFIYAFGGKLYNEETGKLVLDKEAVYKWFATEKAFVDAGLLPSDMMAWDWGKQIHPTVVDGKTFAFIGGVWHWTEWQTKAYHTDPTTGELRPLTSEEVREYFYYTLFPAGEPGKKAVTLSQPFAWVINSKAGYQNPDYDRLKDVYQKLAFLLVVKASDPDINAIHSIISAHLPVRKEASKLLENTEWVNNLVNLPTILSDEVKKNIKDIVAKTANPINIGFLKDTTYMLEYTTFTPKHPQYPKLADLFKEAIDKVLRGTLSPEEAVNYIIDKINADPELKDAVEIVGEIPTGWSLTG